MSDFNKAKKFSDTAKELERQLFDEQGNLRSEPTTPDPEPTPDPTPEPVTPPEPTVEEKKYKEAVKAMNEAQRKAAEAEKRAKEQEEKQAELQKRLEEVLKAKETPVVVEDEDDLESDLPEVTKIAERKAKKEADAVRAELAEIKKKLEAEELAQKAKADEQAGILIVQEILKSHSDYEEIANSEELKNWVENEAPPMYKSIYEGKTAATAADIVEVISRFKSTRVPTPDKPSDTSIASKSVSVPSSKSDKPAPLSEAEIREFQNKGHRWPKEQREAFNRRLEAMFA